MGTISANISQVTRFILRGDDTNSSVSMDNLFHVFRCLPELETLVVTGMPLDNVVAALNRLRDDSDGPVLRRLRYLYTRGIGGNSLSLTRFLGQRLEPELPVPQVVCPASLKNAIGTRYGDVRAIEDLKPGEFPKPFTVPERMQTFLKTNLETVRFRLVLRWLRLRSMMSIEPDGLDTQTTQLDLNKSSNCSLWTAARSSQNMYHHSKLIFAIIHSFFASKRRFKFEREHEVNSCSIQSGRRSCETILIFERLLSVPSTVCTRT
jgi:hypothetical protein